MLDFLVFPNRRLDNFWPPVFSGLAIHPWLVSKLRWEESKDTFIAGLIKLHFKRHSLAGVSVESPVSSTVSPLWQEET